MNDPTRTLRLVLEQERRRGYQDSTVSGGLDAMLRGLHLSGLLTAGSPAHDVLVETLAYPYRQLTPAMRERWVERTLAALDRPRLSRPPRQEPPERPSAIRIGVTAPLASGRRRSVARKPAPRTKPADPKPAAHDDLA